MEQATAERFFEAIAMYNSGDYLACQERLDLVYAESNAGEQPMVRAMALLATAMHLHFNRGGGRGVLNLLRQCLLVLDDVRPECLGVDTDELYDALDAYLQELHDRRRPGASIFDRWLAPRIRYRPA